MEIFRNLEWVVNEEGLESMPAAGSYFISMDDVMETTDRTHGKFYDWPLHFGEKVWVKIALFLEAFEEAIRFYAEREGLAIDERMLIRSCREAHYLHQREMDFCARDL